MSIYDSIVNGISQTKTSQLSIAAYLQSLKPSVKLLRRSYLNKPVYVPYHQEDVQAAYLIIYLPHYYNLIYSILIAEGEAIFGEKETINIGYIGGGPGSEVYGTIKYILNNRPSINKVNIVVFDINADTWKFSHKIVQDYLIRDIKGSERIEFTWTANQFDLTNASDIQANQSIFKKLQLLVIQNCLNEIAANKFEKLKVNVNSIFSLLPGSSIFLMSDLTSGARDVIKQLEKHLVETGKTRYKESTLGQPTPLRSRSINPAPSQIIKDNLLTGADGLIPRVNLIYDYSLLSKEQITERETIEEVGFMALYEPLATNQTDANDYVHTKTFVGIDFGTSSTVVSYAFLENDQLKVESVPIMQREPDRTESKDTIVPSVIAISNNVFMVGKHAAERKSIMTYGQDIWYNFKEHLSILPIIDHTYSALRDHASYKINNDKDALILFFKYLKKQTEEHIQNQGLPIDIAYAISIPANFESDKKAMLKSCLTTAGIDCEDTPFIDEPNAALINYLFEQNIHLNKNEKSENIIVIDLGAGTVDVSIIEISRSKEGLNSQLLSVKRIGQQGGNLIDECIAKKQFANQAEFEVISRKSKEELLNLAEKLKIKIAKDIITDRTVNFALPPKSKSEEKIKISSTDEIKRAGLNEVSLSYIDFNNIMLNYWEEILETIELAIDNAEVETSEISKVILTGGGGRNPYMKNMVAFYFNHSELIIPDNIQEHVAKGTALHSFVLNSYGKNIVTPVLGECVYIQGENKIIEIFKPGEVIPSNDFEIIPLTKLNASSLVVKTYYGSAKNNLKYFIVPSGIIIDKIIFFIASDQELKCEIVTENNVINAEKKYEQPNFNLIHLK
jgi:molecular chaperone DnaK (HSP70)